MTLMIVNKVIYTHGHVKNGKIIFHAHPYNTDNTSQPAENHKHTETEFTLFSQLELLFAFFFLAAAIIVNSYSEQRNTELEIHYNFRYLPTFYGRAPPAA